MPNFADDTNVEVLEKETIQAPEETPIVDEVVEDDAGTEETQADEEVQAEETPEPEGASPAMRELARQWLPEKFIDGAKDDEALKGMIDAARESNVAPPPQQAEEDPEFDLKWPEDDDLEVPEVVRKKVTELNDHYKGQVKQLKSDMGKIVKIAQEMQEQQEFQANIRFQAVKSAFDKTLDGYDLPIVGKAGELDTGQLKIRTALFEDVQDKVNSTGGDPAAITEEIASRMLRGVQSKQQKQAYSAKVREQSNGRLGSGNSPRLPEPAKSKDKEFEEFLEKLGARHIK